MKKIFFLLILVMIVSCSTSHLINKDNYQIYFDGETKNLKGVINRTALEKDTAFNWFKENMKWGQADITAVEAFSKKADKFSILVFGGTWCHDTQNLLPVLYRLIDKSGYPEKKVTVVMVDRKKQALNDLPQQYNLKNTPTFIVLHDGKEVGRIIEYGKYGAIDKELGEIVNTIP